MRDPRSCAYGAEAEGAHCGPPPPPSPPPCSPRRGCSSLAEARTERRRLRDDDRPGAGSRDRDPADVAACVELEQRIAIVSHVVSGSTEAITKAINPKQLARLTGEAQQSLVISARALELADAPAALARSKRRLVAGLREYAADFERARRSTARGDIETAAGQLHDEIALDKIVTSLKKIDRACRA